MFWLVGDMAAAAKSKCIGLLLLAMVVGGTHGQTVPTTVNIDERVKEKFDDEVGDAAVILELASIFVWVGFAQVWPTGTKDVRDIVLNVENIDSVTLVRGNVIFLDSDYIDSYEGDLKKEVTGILYQAVTDIWQWDANGAAPKWWREGVSNYIRLIAGYAPANFAQPGSGDSWEQGGDVTARFIQYVNTITPGFVGLVNAKIKTSWDIGYFKDITGKSVDDLWKDYKAQ